MKSFIVLPRAQCPVPARRVTFFGVVALGMLLVGYFFNLVM